MRPTARTQAPAFALVFLLLAGCLGGAEEDVAPAAPTSATPTADPGAAPEPLAEGGMEEALVDATPVTKTFYLNGDGALIEEVPAASSRPMAGSYVKCFTTPPCDFFSFQSAPMATDVLIPPQTVSVRYHLQADGPVAPGAFGYAAWFGSTKGTPLYRIAEASALAPGATVEVEISLELQGAPLLVPRGESLRLLGLAGNMHEGTGILKLLMGGDTPSSVTLRMVNTTLEAAGPETSETFTGALPLPGFPAGDAVPEDKRATSFTFKVGPNATRVTVALRQTGGPTSGDLDMDLYEGGTQISGAHTPTADESIFLAGQAAKALRGRELTLTVSNFWAPNAEFEIVVTQIGAPLTGPAATA